MKLTDEEYTLAKVAALKGIANFFTEIGDLTPLPGAKKYFKQTALTTSKADEVITNAIQPIKDNTREAVRKVRQTTGAASEAVKGKAAVAYENLPPTGKYLVTQARDTDTQMSILNKIMLAIQTFG